MKTKHTPEVEAMNQWLEALLPFEKLFREVEKKHVGSITQVNVDCQISVKDLTKCLYAAGDIRQALELTKKHELMVWPEPMEHPPLYADEDPAEQARAFQYRSGWNACLEKCKVKQSDYATIAGLESSVGHLSQMVDELRLLLGTSMDAMKEVEQNGSPIDESHGNVDCCVPYGRWAKFIDARAKLLYAIRNSAHHGLLETPHSSQTEEQS